MRRGGSGGVGGGTPIAEGGGSLAGGVRRRIAIAGGGTAGHVYPGLAVAAAYRELVPDREIIFLGTATGMEARLVPAHGHRLEVVPAAPFVRVGWRGKAHALAAAAAGTRAARRLLRAQRIELVLGLGNYACIGALLAAKSLGIATVLHEANSVPGVSSRLLGRLVDRVLLGYDAAFDAFPASRTAVTGVPVRADVLRRSAARGVPTGRFHVLVSGGSGGSRFLDEHVPDLLARVAASGHVLEARHQVGRGDAARTRAAYARAGVTATVVDYIDDIGEVYAWAHFALACAGAGTLAELAAVGLPALLVPLGSAALDHQTANARAFAEMTGTWWTREDGWDAAALAARIATLAGRPDAWAAASAAVRRAARPAAAAAVVRACEAIVEPGVRARPSAGGGHSRAS